MAQLSYTYQGTELLRCSSATRYPDIGETVTIEGTEYVVDSVYSVDAGTATVVLRLPGKHRVSYYAHGRHIATATVYKDEPLPWHGDRTTINGIHYHVVGREPNRLDLKLYSFPTTLTAYLLMLHSMTEAQFDQWIESLSFSQLNTFNDKWCKPKYGITRQGQLAAYQCTADCGTIVYYNLDRWEAYNADYQASATASTLAELLNTWAEATEHVRYDLVD
jgi:predicted 3-demethylubiquinone-9 3-methyltransferase (glyoxalase superfamily)